MMSVNLNDISILTVEMLITLVSLMELAEVTW